MATELRPKVILVVVPLPKWVCKPEFFRPDPQFPGAFLSNIVDAVFKDMQGVHDTCVVIDLPNEDFIDPTVTFWFEPELSRTLQPAIDMRIAQLDEILNVCKRRAGKKAKSDG